MLQKQDPVVLMSKEILLAPSNSYSVTNCGKWVEGTSVARDVTVKNKQTLVHAENRTSLSVRAASSCCILWNIAFMYVAIT